ncbi:MAG TPA: hypothetical protein VFI45_18515 [Candidatus Acidoferrum sp.]|nr:hypothetical protein [Candidatus Acidoferrum sp.]
MRKPASTKAKSRIKAQAKKQELPRESLESIYERLSKLLARYAPPFRFQDFGVRNKTSVQLVVPKPVAIPGAYGGKPVDLQFAAAILQKGYVGFYLMCIYMNEPVKKKISPALLKLLKGKTCFYLKGLDASLEKDIEAALEEGAKYYRVREWV